MPAAATQDPKIIANRKCFLAGLRARGMRVVAPNPVRYTDAIIAAILGQWAEPEPGKDVVKTSFTTEEEDRAAEEEARSKVFAGFMAQARALKPGDDAGVQNLMYKAAYEAARSKLTDLQAEMLIRAINKSTGFKLGVLRPTWGKKLKEAKEEAKAEAAAAGSAGPGGSAGSSGSTGSYGSSKFYLDETGLYWRDGKQWERVSQTFEVLGLARSTEDDEWGKFIKFTNEDKKIRHEIITSAMLHSDPIAVAAD